MTRTAGNTEIGIFALTGDEYRVMVAMNLHGYRLVSATPAKVQTIVEMHNDFKTEISHLSEVSKTQSELIEVLETAIKTKRGKAKARMQDELIIAKQKMQDIYNMIDQAWSTIRSEASNVLRSA